MKAFYFISSLILSLVSCAKDHAPNQSVENYEFKIYTINQSGQLTTEFKQDEEIIFKVEMKNGGESIIRYYEGLKCAEMKLRIYDQNTMLVGVPHDENMACQEDLRLDQIEGGKSKFAEIGWYNNPTNPKLPPGEYKVVFESKIALDKPENWKKIKEEFYFIIQ